MKPVRMSAAWLRSGLSLAVASLAATVTLVPVTAAHAADVTYPPSLTGETLETSVVDRPHPFPGTIDEQSNCNDTGTSSITFSVTGTASGPYAGPFELSGSATFGAPTELPYNPNSRPLLSFQEQFTIYAPNGTVVGNKTLAPAAADMIGHDTDLALCGGDGFYGQGISGAAISARATYEARVTTDSGTYSDTGQVSTLLQSGGYTPATQGWAAFFEEYFGSAQQTALPVLPTSKDQCRDEAWRTFGVFKNQGDCISYVEHND